MAGRDSSYTVGGGGSCQTDHALAFLARYRLCLQVSVSINYKHVAKGVRAVATGATTIEVYVRWQRMLRPWAHTLDDRWHICSIDNH